MDFNDKPSLEELRRERENRAHLHNGFHLRFLVGTIGMILVVILCVLNQGA